MERFTGKTITNIAGLNVGSESIIFTFQDGDSCEFYHEQGCCESVNVCEFDGEECLMGNRVISANELIDESDTDWGTSTSTFYTITTTEGVFHLRLQKRDFTPSLVICTAKEIEHYVLTGTIQKQ